MSTSRRRFVKTGIIAAAIAALPLEFGRTASAQKRNERIGPIRTENPLAYFNKATFSAHTQTYFLVHYGSTAPLTMKLVLVEELAQNEALTAPDECFELMFEAPSGALLPQRTYTIEHAALGKFPLFLVPVSRLGAAGPARYQAIFNRRQSLG